MKPRIRKEVRDYCGAASRGLKGVCCGRMDPPAAAVLAAVGLAELLSGDTICTTGGDTICTTGAI